ncbi:MAG: leucyl/phenylalanyl-tRNA--protein transferase [Flavobacteriales bacterium]|nr:leucyl/phenylalanyl-tRNA--protein transferase [Flavobacteriales bacterium]
MPTARVLLTADLLLSTYRRGIFPMAEPAGSTAWHDPDPRAIFDLGRLTMPSRLARFVRTNGYVFSIDRAFDEVIHACADRTPRWLSADMIHAYSALHRIGHAHALETWKDGELIGGIYGVAINGAFFGESMFSREPNASKAAFYHLAEHLRTRGFKLFDTQYINDHTASLGAFLIPRERFRTQLKEALDLAVEF